jgi:hypothetical protein
MKGLASKRASGLGATRPGQRGSAMFLVVLVLVGLAGLAAALTTTTLNRYGAERALQEAEVAHRAVMAGFDLALFELRRDQDLGVDGIGNASGTLDGANYQVQVTPTYVGPGQYTLTGTGSLGPVRTGAELVVDSTPQPGFGLFAIDGVTMSGSFSSDSYNSTLGTYASQFSVDHAGDEGSIGSNGDINAGGGYIFGDATPGPAGQVLGDPSLVMGSVAPALTPKSYPPPTYTPPIASSGAHSGPGSLNSGTYRYDSFTLSGGTVFTIDGDVELWVDADFVASGSSIVQLTPGSSLVLKQGTGKFTVSGGGFINPSQDPKDLEISSASDETFTLSGGSSFFGTVYAPDAPFVSSGGSHLYGAIVAKTANLSGAGWMHYDEALAAPGSGPEAFPVISARRVNSW